MTNQAGRRPDPLTVVAVLFGAGWLLFALLARPIGGYGVETDFFGDLGWARRWYAEGPTLMTGFRGPLYHLVLGALAALLHDGFLAGKLISVVSASVGLRVLGGLVRGLFGSAAGLGATLFAAAAPLYMEHTFLAGTDMFFLALFVSVLALTLGKDNPSVRRWMVAGTLAGAAWLSRPNGLLLLPIGAIAALTAVRPLSRSVRVLMVFAGAMLAVASPWLIFVAARTGNPLWSNTYKIFASSIYGPSPGLAQQGELADYVGFASIAEVFRLDPGHVIACVPGQIWNHLRGDVTRLAGFAPAAVSLAGIMAGLWSRAWAGRRSTAFWISGAVVFAGMLPVFYNPRFMLPLLVWWAAAGGGLLHAAVHARPRRRVSTAEGLAAASSKKRAPGPTRRFVWATPAATVVGLLLLGLIAWNSVAVIRRSLDPEDIASPPTELVELERVVKRGGLPIGPKTPIAARKPHIGYLLKAPVIPIPEGGVNELRSVGAHYLLVSALEANAYPLLAPLLYLNDPADSPAGLRLVAGVTLPTGDGRARGARLYAVEDPLPWTPPPESNPVMVLDTEPGLDRMDTLRLRLARWYLLWSPDPSVDRLLELMAPEARRHPAVLTLEGDAALLSHDAAAAVRLYRRSLVADPDRPSTYMRLVGARLLSEPDLSARDLLRLPAAGLETVLQDSTASWWTVAEPYLAEGSYAAAVAPLIACTEAAPANAGCYRYLGMSLMALGWYERAAELFGRCLELDPEDLTARDALRAAEAKLIHRSAAPDRP